MNFSFFLNAWNPSKTFWIFCVKDHNLRMILVQSRFKNVFKFVWGTIRVKSLQILDQVHRKLKSFCWTKKSLHHKHFKDPKPSVHKKKIRWCQVYTPFTKWSILCYAFTFNFTIQLNPRVLLFTWISKKVSINLDLSSSTYITI
jgi:hypothetical protein